MMLSVRLRDAEIIGEKRGMELGEKRGFEIGEKRGMEIGKKRGIELGELRMKNTAKKLLLSGMSISDVQMMTELPLESIMDIQMEIELKH